MTNLPEAIGNLIAVTGKEDAEKTSQNDADVVSVDDVAARVASFYEKIRDLVDWREEHLLRKAAVARVLERRLLLKSGHLSGEEGLETSEQFIKELVRRGHFPNRRLPAVKIEEVRRVLDKYAAILRGASFKNLREGRKMEEWLVGIASYEIEITLDPHERELGLVNFMAGDVASRLKIKGNGNVTEEEAKLQIYVAAHRALFKMDDAVVSYCLLENFYRDWHNLTEETITSVAAHLMEIKAAIDKILNNPLSESFYNIAERYDTPYLILGDLVFENPAAFPELISQPEKLDSKIKDSYKARLVRLKGRIGRAAFYSTVSIFLGKVLVVLALEIPVDRYMRGHFNYVAMLTSILVPPILMLFLVAGSKITSTANFEEVKGRVKSLIAGVGLTDYYVYFPKKKGSLLRVVLQFLYFSSFIVSFGFVWWLLLKAGFGPFSIIVFILFMSLVAFAGTKIQQHGMELMVGETKRGFIAGLLDFFFLPVIELGRWLSRQLARYNGIVFIFNFLIETPIQVFVEFLEQWRAFLKEKKEEIH